MCHLVLKLPPSSQSQRRTELRAWMTADPSPDTCSRLVFQRTHSVLPQTYHRPPSGFFTVRIQSKPFHGWCCWHQTPPHTTALGNTRNVQCQSLVQSSILSSPTFCTATAGTVPHLWVDYGLPDQQKTISEVWLPPDCLPHHQHWSSTRLCCLPISVLSKDCISSHSSIKLVKFADDTMILGQRQYNDELTYRNTLSQLAALSEEKTTWGLMLTRQWR